MNERKNGIAIAEIAPSARTKIDSFTCAVGQKISRVNHATKTSVNSASAAAPHTGSGAASIFSSAAEGSAIGLFAGSAGGALNRNAGSFSRSLTDVTPATAAHVVAMSAVPMIAVGSFDPAAARIATAVAGMSWMELVLIARNVHIAFVAVPGRGLSDSRWPIARRPRAVAELPRPSMFAAMFITIAPSAGCSGGTSGKSFRMSGRMARAMICMRPDRSASRMIPSQSAMMPTRPIASVTAFFAPSSAPLVTSGNLPVKPPITTPASKRKSQM